MSQSGDDRRQLRTVLKPLTKLKKSDISLVVEIEIAGKRISTTPLLTALHSRNPSIVRSLLKSKCSLSSKDQTEALRRAFRLLLSGDTLEAQTAAEIFAGLSYPGRLGAPVLAREDLQWLRNHLSELTSDGISHAVRTMYDAWPDDRMLAIVLLASSLKTTETANSGCDDWTTCQVETMEELLLIGLKCSSLFDEVLALGTTKPLGPLVPFLLKYLTTKTFSVSYIRKCFPSSLQESDRLRMRQAYLIFHLGFFPWTRAEDKLDDYFPCCMKEDGICPHPLQDLCRGAVRRSLSADNALVGVRQLPPLPTKVKEFLLLDDVYLLSVAT